MWNDHYVGDDVGDGSATVDADMKKIDDDDSIFFTEHEITLIVRLPP